MVTCSKLVLREEPVDVGYERVARADLLQQHLPQLPNLTVALVAMVIRDEWERKRREI